jgi:hypothetical protein
MTFEIFFSLSGLEAVTGASEAGVCVIHMCRYVYVCIYVSMCMCVCVCVCVYIYIHILLYVFK